MKTKRLTLLIGMTLLAALAMPIGMTAQDNPSPNDKPKHKKYKLVDMGTLGGLSSTILQGNGSRALNNNGLLAGSAETIVPLSSTSNFFACSGPTDVTHAFAWQKGNVTDLRALSPATENCSTPLSTNDNGQIAGVSEDGTVDPVLNLNGIRAVLWKNGQLLNLGSLGGSASFSQSINNRGQVVGFSTNTVIDPFSLYGFFFFASSNSTQTRGFVWQYGHMEDLGTLGGADANAAFVNDRGQISGESYTNSIPNPTTGIPTLDPYLWERGNMTDLGTLGGVLGFVNAMNNRGQVVGLSDLAGDLTNHAFLWDRGVLNDLGTFGGSTSEADWINDAGQVVGIADLADGTHHAFVWWRGKMTDLGTVNGDPCSNGFNINSSGQAVGTSTDCQGTVLHVFLWEHGSMINLSALIQPGSDLTFVEPFVINDRGEIGGIGILPNGDEHAALLIPEGDCDGDCEGRINASQNGAAPAQYPATMKRDNESRLTPIERIRSIMRQRYHMRSQPAAPEY